MINDNYCITGLAGSGKDTCGDYIAKQLGKETYALAYPIKQLVSALLNTSIKDLDDRSKKEKMDFYSVTVDSLEKASQVYAKLGLGEYQDFHDAWDDWIDLFQLKLTPWGNYETWLAPRHFFQLMGTEWGRSLHEDVWVRMTPENVVVTDVRMDNEAEYFRGKDYYLVDVIRESQMNIESSQHLSEKGVSFLIPRITIYNDGSLDLLRGRLDHLIS